MSRPSLFTSLAAAALVTALLAAPGCGSTSATPDAGPGVTYRCQASTPACLAQSDVDGGILKFRTVLSDGGVSEEGATVGERSYIDARAGGATVPQSYTYVAFSDAGLRKVLITDEESLSSLDWDLAFRRANIRLNSGASGPSCVLGGAADAGESFASLTRATGVPLAAENYFDTTCAQLPDPHGATALATQLTGFYNYSDCLDTSAGQVFVVQLRDSSYVKVQVLSYYDAPTQALCNDGGLGSNAPSGSAQYRLNWKYIPGP
jgi:HmuY protein